jgi:hypothetical protein
LFHIDSVDDINNSYAINGFRLQYSPLPNENLNWGEINSAWASLSLVIVCLRNRMQVLLLIIIIYVYILNFSILYI